MFETFVNVSMDPDQRSQKNKKEKKKKKKEDESVRDGSEKCQNTTIP